MVAEMEGLDCRRRYLGGGMPMQVIPTFHPTGIKLRMGDWQRDHRQSLLR